MVIIGPLIDPEEGLVKKLENVEMKIDRTQMNSGTLYITEKWVNFFFASLHRPHQFVVYEYWTKNKTK